MLAAGSLKPTARSQNQGTTKSTCEHIPPASGSTVGSCMVSLLLVSQLAAILPRLIRKHFSGTNVLRSLR